jgi:trans-aconitate methyltransferase
MSKEQEELLPCPFCGEPDPLLNEIEPHTHFISGMPDHPGSFTVECGCGCGLIDESKENVIRRWNTRPTGGIDEAIKLLAESAEPFDKACMILRNSRASLANEGVQELVKVIKRLGEFQIVEQMDIIEQALAKYKAHGG